MLTSKVARRYAQGLLDFTKESNETEVVYNEMKEVVTIMKESKDFKKFLATPFIDYKKKLAVSTEVFKNFSTSVQNMISLIIKQGREKQLQNIAQEFINKVEDLKGIQRARLTIAQELSEDNIHKIVNSNQLITSSNFELSTKIDPEILGGYILRVGDQQIDASIKTKLNKLRKEFKVN